MNYSTYGALTFSILAFNLQGMEIGRVQPNQFYLLIWLKNNTAFIVQLNDKIGNNIIAHPGQRAKMAMNIAVSDRGTIAVRYPSTKKAIKNFGFSIAYFPNQSVALVALWDLETMAIITQSHIKYDRDNPTLRLDVELFGDTIDQLNALFRLSQSKTGKLEID